MNIGLWVIFCFFLILTGCHPEHKKLYQGYIEVKNLYLASPYSGVLITQHIVRGQPVKKGQTLVNLDPHPQVFMLDESLALEKQATFGIANLRKGKRKPEIQIANAKLVEAIARRELGKLRLKRFETLYKTQATDRDHVDEAIYNDQVRIGEQEEAEANLFLSKLGARPDEILSKQAQETALKAKSMVSAWALDQKNIYAPVDAVVFDTYYGEGEFVPADKPILSLLDPKNVRIEFFVPAEDLPSLELNQTIHFTCDGSPESNDAVINYISPEAEYSPPLIYSRENKSTIVFRVKATVVDSHLFKPGQPVVVSVTHG